MGCTYFSDLRCSPDLMQEQSFSNAVEKPDLHLAWQEG